MMEQTEYTFLEELTPEEVPFPDCGIIYKEVCTMQIHSYSVSENGMSAVAGDHYVNVYDQNGTFVCGFYSYTSHSSLEVVMHDDWIEICNSGISSRYYAYTLDGTLLVCGRMEDYSGFGDSTPYMIEIGNAQYRLRGMNRKFVMTSPEGNRNIYEMCNETHTLVFPEPAEIDENEPHIIFDTVPSDKVYDTLPVSIDGNDYYVPLKYAVNSAGEVLLCTGDYLHIYNPEGQYERSLYLRSASLLDFAFYTDCIQLWNAQKRTLVTYDRNGSVLEAASVPDTPDNKAAIQELEEQCYTDSHEENNACYQMYHDRLSLVKPDNRITILYQQQEYKLENTRHGMIGSWIIAAVMLAFILGILKVHKEEQQN